MRAQDIMTTDVISVTPDAPVREIAACLLAHRISAVPVIGSDGGGLGMVSEGDLLGGDDTAARRDWWLTLLAEGETLSPTFVADLRNYKRTARQIMSAPLISVSPATDVAEVARLLASYRIKRVPVIEDGRIVGIVSRADLSRALAARDTTPAVPLGRLAAAVASLDEHFHHRPIALPTVGEEAMAPDPASPAAPPAPSAAAFRHLVEVHQTEAERSHAAARQAAADQRTLTVQALIGQHISDDAWQKTLERARQAAEHGEKELLLMRFPSDLCSDGGRAINAPEPDWPATLRGAAAETYLRWERDLKPRGFRLTAQVLDFPGGVPGDIGLTLYWGA